LRRLDRDEPYMEALEAATGVTGLAGRSPQREYIWVDPAEAAGQETRVMPTMAPAPAAADVDTAAEAESGQGRSQW
jgi:hypothetical protein